MKYILFIFILIGSLFQLSCKEDDNLKKNENMTLEETKKYLEANRKYEMVKGCKVIERTRIIESGIFIAIDPAVELVIQNDRLLTIPDDLARSVVFGDTEAVKCLLDKGHDPNSRSDPFGSSSVRPNSALFWAVFKNFPKIVKLLIEAGADVNEKNENGIPFLLEKAQNLKHTEVAEILKDHGAKARKPIR